MKTYQAMTGLQFYDDWKDYLQSELPRQIDVLEGCSHEGSVVDISTALNTKETFHIIDSEREWDYIDQCMNEFGAYYDAFLESGAYDEIPPLENKGTSEEIDPAYERCREIYQEMIEERIHADWSRLYSDTNALVIPVKNQWDIQTDEVSLTSDTVDEDEEFLAFKAEALKYISEDDFNYVLDNSALCEGCGFIGGIFEGDYVIDMVNDPDYDDIKTHDVVVGVINRFDGSGCYIHETSQIKFVIPIGEKVFCDHGSYSMWDIYGRDVPWSGK
jgi:hypothetical protein